MWGTHHRADVDPDRCGFIPTHVGNTAGRKRGACPRCGSSPRMWGTRIQQMDGSLYWRFIPTHVGNTGAATAAGAVGAVHPHACGEHPRRAGHAGTGAGSSPRMWGTPFLLHAIGPIRRFIPTHVGNTGERDRQGSDPPVHPHACGEHSSAICRSRCSSGSSPRMWGTHLPYRIVFKEEKTPRKIYRLILYSVVRSRGWNATNCSPSNNTGCRRLTPRVWNS